MGIFAIKKSTKIAHSIALSNSTLLIAFESTLFVISYAFSWTTSAATLQMSNPS